MNELKPEDVMRALECWASDRPAICKDCAYRRFDGTLCGKGMARDALALLREKDAAHKELWEERMRIYQDLQEYKAECKKLLEEFNKLIAEKDAEIERWKAEYDSFEEINEMLVEENNRLKEAIKIARAEAITEVSEKLKEAVKYIPWCDYPPVHRCIDEIADKMKGEENGESDL